ncbi:hypothetical protein AOLI_G00257220 [Acnodon oligacanthus]
MFVIDLSLFPPVPTRQVGDDRIKVVGVEGPGGSIARPRQLSKNANRHQDPRDLIPARSDLELRSEQSPVYIRVQTAGRVL